MLSFLTQQQSFVSIHDHIVSFQSSPKPTYEVTEKYPENVFEVAKIETPIGFSKQVRSQELKPLKILKFTAQHEINNYFTVSVLTSKTRTTKLAKKRSSFPANGQRI